MMVVHQNALLKKIIHVLNKKIHLVVVINKIKQLLLLNLIKLLIFIKQQEQVIYYLVNHCLYQI